MHLPLWLSLGLAAFVVLIAIWQVPRIRVRLSGDYTAPAADQDVSSALKHWRKLLMGLLIFLTLGTFGDALLWTQTTHEMAGIRDIDSDKKEIDEKHPQKLPISYVLKKTLWQFGLTPLPTLINIPAGEFMMGNDTGLLDEQPIHKVTIPNAFAMSQHEITFEQYDYFIWTMKEATYRYPYDQGWGRDKRPVINVSWWDAQAYANWLSKQVNQQCRLPSEAEWEYAARAGSTTKYPWGDNVGQNNANCDGCSSEWDNKQTAPVGRFKPNAFGLYDMHGNVWEWVQDPWHSDYKGAPSNGSAWEVNGDASRRVLRGGTWYLTPNSLHSAFRNYGMPDLRNDTFGFRIVCSSH